MGNDISAGVDSLIQSDIIGSMFIEDLVMQPKFDILNIFQPLQSAFDDLMPSEFISKIDEILPQDKLADLVSLDLDLQWLAGLNQFGPIVETVVSGANIVRDSKVDIIGLFKDMEPVSEVSYRLRKAIIDISELSDEFDVILPNSQLFEMFIRYFSQQCQNICEPINNIVPMLPCADPCDQINQALTRISDFKSSFDLVKESEEISGDHFNEDKHEFREDKHEHKAIKFKTTTTTTTTVMNKIEYKLSILDNLRNRVENLPTKVKDFAYDQANSFDKLSSLNVEELNSLLTEINPLVAIADMKDHKADITRNFADELNSIVHSVNPMDRLGKIVPDATKLLDNKLFKDFDLNLSSQPLIAKIADLNLNTVLKQADKAMPFESFFNSIFH